MGFREKTPIFDIYIVLMYYMFQLKIEDKGVLYTNVSK